MGLSYSEKMNVVRKHHDDYPVQMLPLAKELGLSVFYVKEWPDQISGMITKDHRSGPSGFTIYVNANHSQTRRRFTLAHEIAHFIKHEDVIGKDGIQDDRLYRSNVSSRIEAEANRVAADILMPFSLLNIAMADGKLTIPELAEAFDVSPSAMSIQLGVPYDDKSPVKGIAPVKPADAGGTL